MPHEGTIRIQLPRLRIDAHDPGAGSGRLWRCTALQRGGDPRRHPADLELVSLDRTIMGEADSQLGAFPTCPHGSGASDRALVHRAHPAVLAVSRITRINSFGSGTFCAALVF